MAQPLRVDAEAARLRQQHGYTWAEAYALAELVAMLQSIGVFVVMLDDIPHEGSR